MTAEPKAKLILASASPRRLDLLRQIGLEPDAVVPADVDESPIVGERVSAMARRLSAAKCDAVTAEYSADYVLAADTLVAVGRRLLGKPADRAEAEAHLQLLSGRRHRVVTGLALAAPDGSRTNRLVQTIVTFRRLPDADIIWYLDKGDWRGKAGSYAIQGRAGAFARSINGSYSNIVGLPLAETRGMLEAAGYPVRG